MFEDETMLSDVRGIICRGSRDQRSAVGAIRRVS